MFNLGLEGQLCRGRVGYAPTKSGAALTGHSVVDKNETFVKLFTE